MCIEAVACGRSSGPVRSHRHTRSGEGARRFTIRTRTVWPSAAKSAAVAAASRSSSSGAATGAQQSICDVAAAIAHITIHDLRIAAVAAALAALPGADEQPFHLLRLDGGDRERVERGCLRAEALQRDPQVAAPELGADVLGGIHDGTDHHQDDAVVLRGRIGADLAGCLRTLDQLRGERVELCTLLPRAIRRVRRAEQDLLQPAVVRPELERPFVGRDDGMPRVRVVEPLLVDARPRVELLLEERVDEQLLVGKAAVDRADADAGVMGDVVQRDPETPFREQLARRVEDALPVALGVLAEGLLLRAHHHSLPEVDNTYPNVLR